MPRSSKPWRGHTRQQASSALAKNRVQRYSRVVLTPELLLAAYSAGLFPMAINEQGDLGWFSPDPRAIIPLDQRFHIPHGLQRALKRNPPEISVNRRFAEVIGACANAHGETWISKEIIQGYCRLHEIGHAHSIEVLRDGNLIGGLYGVQIGGAFFGESMFHKETNASNFALVGLVELLRGQGFLLLDTQWMTPHLARFGTVLIPKPDYLALLDKAISTRCGFAAAASWRRGLIPKRAS